MLRKPPFWILCALLSVLATFAAGRHFASAFPLVSIDLRMDRGRALESARALAAQHRLGPPGFRQAATFGGDEEVQTYVELEAGGKDAFARMIRDGRYAPYTWRVRHFREHDPNETWVRFTPEGVPYGFMERLPETAPGARLAPGEARGVAERGAASWHVALSQYALVEQAQEEKPGRRIDHTLVYERPERLGEGRFRVRLVVAGDRLVEVTPFVRVPEAFGRRYQQMRSANEAIGFGSGIAMLVLYGVGGIVIGLFVLMRQRWVLWRPALAWGLIVAGLQVLATLNEWPLAWLRYDTALSTTTYLVQQATAVTAGAVGMTVVFTLSFMAAESLSRRAFPDHPQLWRVWAPEAGASRAVLGRTLGAYLLVAIFFAYEVALYLVASRWLGWWTPSDALVHPDVLATYMPWLSAIAPSVQAGFWEECLFRAVPLAGAALIGDRFGRRRAFIAAAMIVQAIVFGAGHAPYPNQPAYARPVELILPSLLFGVLYLRFGLLPAIVLHIAFDIVWFALPLFVSRAPGILIDRTLVVILALVPLWIVLWRRWQAGRWTDLPSGLANGAWRPEPAAETAPLTRSPRQAGTPPRVARVLLGAGAVGILAAAVLATRQAQDVRPLHVSRAPAAARATDALRERGLDPEPPWRILPSVSAVPDETHEFVRSTAGHETYRQLLGTYLPGPRWRVRAARFEGDITARAEEWTVVVERDGSVSRVRHTLPETAPGAALTEDQARTLARETAHDRFALDPAKLREVSTAPSKLPARTDWLVTFADASRAPLPQGELRLAVAIAGDRITDAWRFVHVPETWQREIRDRRTLAGVVNAAGVALLGGLVLGFAAMTLVAWSRGQTPGRGSLYLFLLLAGARTLDFANGWPARLAGFSTAQPFPLQAAQLAIGLLVGATLMPAVIALAAGGLRLFSAGVYAPREAARIGVGLGGVACGVLGAATALMRAGGEPVWPSFAGAETILPAAAPPLAAIFSLGARTVVVGLVFSAADRISDGWSVHRGWAALLLVGTGLLLGAGAPGASILAWAAAGLLVGLLLLAAYIFVFRWDLSPLPLSVAVVVALGALAEGLTRPYPGALAGSILAAALVLALAWRGFRP